MSKATARPENGDSVHLDIGGGLVRKLLPYILGPGIIGGVTAFKMQHDNEIADLKRSVQEVREAQKEDSAKLDVIMDGLEIEVKPKKRRR
jgi:hypothetical protein